MAKSSGSLVKIISEKWVKPSSPTPPSSRYYKLSSIDTNFGDWLTPLAIFYPKENFHGQKYSFDMLETSLSKTLTYYYPFAGRFLNDNITIECNDIGVQLWEVEIQASMSEILDPPTDYGARNIVFPQGMNYYSNESSRVMVQFSHFSCGGISIAICMSHKLGDVQTLSNFLEDWSTIAHGLLCGSASPLPAQPILRGASIFPPPPSSHPSSFEKTILESALEKSTITTRRFVFSSPNLYKLKQMMSADAKIENVSKVEVVTSLIFKTAISASRRISNSIFKPSALTHMVNFRSLTNPVLSEGHVGNFLTIFSNNATVEEEVEKLRLSEVVTEVKKSKMDIVDAFRNTDFERNDQPIIKEILRQWEKAVKKLSDKSLEMYMFSSWCKFPFCKVDFGFGKPIFSCTTSGLLKNSIVLMDTSIGDGIEAFVTLKEDQMSIFEQDEELLAFATLNPNICVPN